MLWVLCHVSRRIPDESVNTYHQENSAPANEVALQALVDDPFRRVHVQGSQDIVQDQNLSPRINGPSERHPRLLTTAQRQSLLPHLCPVSRFEQRQVLAQPTLIDDLAVPDLVEFRTKQDVVADRLVLDPGLLSSVRHTVLPRKVEPRVRPGRHVVQLSEQRHQKRCLSATGGSNDQIDLSLFEDHFVINPEIEVSARGTGSDGPRGPG